MLFYVRFHFKNELTNLFLIHPEHLTREHKDIITSTGHDVHYIKSYADCDFGCLSILDVLLSEQNMNVHEMPS